MLKEKLNYTKISLNNIYELLHISGKFVKLTK